MRAVRSGVAVREARGASTKVYRGRDGTMPPRRVLSAAKARIPRVRSGPGVGGVVAVVGRCCGAGGLLQRGLRQPAGGGLCPQLDLLFRRGLLVPAVVGGG